jgi:hypothetical protein
VACFGNGSAGGGMVFTATGIAPGWKNNRTSLLMIPNGGINRNAKQRWRKSDAFNFFFSTACGLILSLFFLTYSHEQTQTTAQPI